jgi:hypothetical protein
VCSSDLFPRERLGGIMLYSDAVSDRRTTRFPGAPSTW